MHIPDGFLSFPVATTSGLLSAGGLGMALRQAHLHLPRKKIPLMGLSAAFIFATQMLNFPVAGGTSGHLIGGVLASVLLGPGPAVIVLASVLIVQCFVFADGGVLALGANIFNMGLVSSVGGYFFYRLVCRVMPGPRGVLVGVAFASWCATVLAACVCAGELALSGAAPWSTAFPAMAGVHMLIGVGEAIITTLVVFAVQQSRPDLLDIPTTPGSEPVRGQMSEVLVYGLIIALGLAVFVSPFACSWPDGLDHVAAKLGFSAREVTARAVASPIPDYHMPGITSPVVATALAGALGTLLAFVLALVLARVLVPVKPSMENHGSP